MVDQSLAEAQARPDDKAAVLATFETLRHALNAGNAQSFVDNLPTISCCSTWRQEEPLR
jgi:uncharacterized protein (DUF2267 family)